MAYKKDKDGNPVRVHGDSCWPESQLFQREKEIETAQVNGYVCQNCNYWAPNLGRGFSNGEMISGLGQCLGLEMNRLDSDHVPWTEPNYTCGDFSSTKELHWWKISYDDIACCVEANNLIVASLKARALCRKSENDHWKWSELGKEDWDE